MFPVVVSCVVGDMGVGMSFVCSSMRSSVCCISIEESPMSELLHVSSGVSRCSLRGLKNEELHVFLCDPCSAVIKETFISVMQYGCMSYGVICFPMKTLRLSST